MCVYIYTHTHTYIYTHTHTHTLYLELDIEQWTGSKLVKEYIKVVYCHSAYLIYMII